VPSFYCDEDVPVGLAPLLIVAGYPTRTTRGVGRLTAWYADQLLFATEQGWTLITHNRKDFHTLHDAWLHWSPRWQDSRPHGGILTLDRGPGAAQIVAAIGNLPVTTNESLTGCTFDWFARGGGTWVQWRS
jgi:hypothetical protein